MPSFAPPPTLVHPAAELFPLLVDDDLARLAKDISQNGLLEPIVVFDGQLLDGRNRRRACEMAGVEPRYVDWRGEGGSPVAFIAGRNLHRRHLSESQRAAIAARVKDMFATEAAERQRARQFGSPRRNSAVGVPPAAHPNEPFTPRAGQPHDDPLNMGVCIEKPRKSTVCVDLHTPRGSNACAAKMFNVSPSLVARATRVIKEGDPLLIDAIHAGDATVSDALAMLSLPKVQQRAAVAAVRSGAARTLRQAVKQQRERRAAGSASVPSLPGIDESQRHAPKRLRRVAKGFEAQCETLLRYVDLAAAACGGPNNYTRRMRENVELLRRTMHQCANDFGRSGRKTPS